MKARYTSAELRYSAGARCTCGAGLAYPLDHADAQELSAWVCSRVLLGEVEMPPVVSSAPSGFFAPIERPDVAGVVHQEFSFASYEIKSEAQPSARGATTRPVGEAVPGHAPPVPVDLARAAFEAYGASTGGKTYDGRDIPPFDVIRTDTPHVAAAWEAAAEAVRKLVKP